MTAVAYSKQHGDDGVDVYHNEQPSMNAPVFPRAVYSGCKNPKIHHDTIFAYICKVCHDTVSIRFDTGACDRYETILYAHSTQSATLYQATKV